MNKNSSYYTKNQEKAKYQGKLYIVATPIGNLSDITQRAITTLSKVSIIATENTRHTNFLLRSFNIKTRLLSFHNYNEEKKTDIVLTKLRAGENIALVSDAGTPLIHDPGYRLVRKCHQSGIRVVPLPGPCAAIVALSASGIPANRFYYAGFLPSQPKKRRNLFKLLEKEPCTLVFYESTHRLLSSLDDMVLIFGDSRYVVIARELTKIWETIYGAPVGELLNWVKEDKNRAKGEIVLIVKGYETKKKFSVEALRTFSLLQDYLSPKSAARLTAKIHDVKKNDLYKYFIDNQIIS